MKTGGDMRSYAVYGLTVAAVWMGWQIVKAPIAERSPPPLALRVAPGSADVLRRAAEAELAAGRAVNAGSLAEASLTRAPFNARALRVLGLVDARKGATERADSLLTLAGNWSLRDDPAHAWLIERRLRQGSYQSAFAHADTLARRWVDGKERIFDLFTTAVLADQRALPALVTAMARKPPWRKEYIHQLLKRPDGDAVILALGLALAKGSSGYDDDELSAIYQDWYGERRFAAIRALRAGVGRPGRLDDVQNGDFSEPTDQNQVPFGWRLDPVAGFSASVIVDDVRPDESALRVEYDGYSSGVVTDQLLMMPAGARVLIGEARSEMQADTSRLRWRVTCVDSGQVLGELVVRASASGWRAFRVPFTVPADQCQVQRLSLETYPGDRRTTIVTWFDKLRMVSSAANGAA